jgi:hypothetical protein
MQLLDAILAFALTMAALATVVTVIMEACLRIARMRKKNFIEVMKLLNKELDKGALNMPADKRWDFFVKVVKNPAEGAAGLLKINSEELLKGLDAKQGNEKVAHSIASLGRSKAAGLPFHKRVGEFLRQIFGDPKRAALYENVSLEYMLRCLAEIDSVKQASLAAGNTLKVEFNRLSQKYEELGSSVSASFKHHAQGWSIGIGIALALVVNIDGLRIFEAYRVDPGLATAVIEQQETFIQNHQTAQSSLAKFKVDFITLQEKVKTARKDLKAAKAAGLKDEDLKPQIQALAETEAALDNLTALKKVQQTTQRAQEQLADLAALGIPLGWTLYPRCPYGESGETWDLSSPRCKAIPEADQKKFTICGWSVPGRIPNTLFNDLGGFVTWFFAVIVTGILIGLGAPFWFDIAKRLSQVRKGLQSASASAEYRLSANNANGDPEKRKKIIETVLEQTASEAKLDEAGALGQRQAFFDLKGDK